MKQCAFCNHTSNNCMELLAHIKLLHSKINNFNIICFGDDCQYAFNNFIKFESHFNSKHN